MVNNNRLAVLTFLIIFSTAIAPVLADGTGLSVTQVQTPFNFRDVGNSTPAVYTIWANVENTGGGTVSFVNVTFIYPFGINPQTAGNCFNSERTFNLTHESCTVGYYNLSAGGGSNATLNVIANISALTMSYAGHNVTRPEYIYATSNASNGSSVVSSATQHNQTPFWINPRPYAHVALFNNTSETNYTIDSANSNGTVYITNWNQTRNGYIAMTPLVQYNSTLGYPLPVYNTYAQIFYMDRTPMEAAADSSSPIYMEPLSYNLTFRIVIPFVNNSSAINQTYNIHSPVAEGNSNQRLVPLLIEQFTQPGMMGENITFIFARPVSLNGLTGVANGPFSVWYAVNNSSNPSIKNETGGINRTIYTTTNLSTERGIDIVYAIYSTTYNPQSGYSTLTIRARNASHLNNTDISILFTLLDWQAGVQSSPITIRVQNISGFNHTHPPKSGDNITTTYLINITNQLGNHTLSNLSIRFITPGNVSILNGSNAGLTHVITDLNNASFKYSTNNLTYAYAAPWEGAINFTKSVNMTDRTGPMQGSVITMNFTIVDVLLGSHFNNWIPGAPGNVSNHSRATLNFTMYMSTPVMNFTNNTPGTGGSRNSYNATIQMPITGRMNLSDKLPGFASNVTDYNITIDGKTYSNTTDGNISISSLIINNLEAGAHSISVSYVVPSAGGGGGDSGSSGGGGGGGGGEGGVALPSERKALGMIPAGTTALAVFEKAEDLYVSQIAITPKREIANAVVKITKYFERPAAVPDPTKAQINPVGLMGTGMAILVRGESLSLQAAEPRKAVFAYLNIETINFKSESLERAEIQFLVNKSWLTKNGFAENDVSLLRYSKNWQKLKTERVGSVGDKLTYKAVSSGLSTFAIYAEGKVLAAEEVEKAPEVVTEEEAQSTITKEVEKKEEVKGKIPIAVYLISILLIAVTVVILIAQKMKKEKAS